MSDVANGQPQRISTLQLAFKDLKTGLPMMRLAFQLGLEDLRDRYSRSKIGFSWIAISFLAFLAVKAVVFSSLNMGDGNFVLHLTIGLALWMFISNIVNNAATGFTSNRGWILSSSLPYTFYMSTMMARALLDFAMIAVAAIAFSLVASPANPLGFVNLLPALFLYTLTGMGLTMILAPMGARFRDIIYATQTAMRMLFFATPIIWMPIEGTTLQTIALINPITHYIELIREPFMHGTVPLLSWLICTLLTALLLFIGFIVFGKTKREVPLWL